MQPAIFGAVTRRKRLLWYSVSLDTLRGFAIFLTVAALVALAFFGYRHWEAWALERQATSLVEEARDLTARLHARGDLVQFADEFATGRELLRQAEEARGKGDLRTTVDKGRQSRDVLAAVLNVLDQRGEGGGEAQFISVSGNVEFRRKAGNDWEEARHRVVLASGDHVRTGANGSADIMFSDGSLYTVSPNSSIVVDRRASGPRGEQSVRMQHGWLSLMTTENPANVETPEARARVSPDSEAFVAYEEESRSGRIGAVRGAVEVSNQAGQVRSLGDLQQVVQEGALLSDAQPLPAQPQLMAPADKREIDASRQREVVLSWLPVDGATGYTLQVSRNRLFGDNVIDARRRGKTSARLRIQGEGNFQWRVAAEGGDDERGPWSAVRLFRVASGANRNRNEDTVPPELEIDEAVGYGSIFIVEGRTEAGATVEVNGEAVQVNADGSFTKTIQLVGEGWSFIEVRARDAWGNTVDRRRRVYIDSP